MDSTVLVKNVGFSLYPGLRVVCGDRPGVVAALFTMLFFLAGCGGSSKTSTPTPTFTPAAGTYTATQYVTVSDTNEGSVLYCTNDGSAPTSSSPQCANPITISQSQTLRAIAIAPGANASAVASAAYNIGASSPTPAVSSVLPSSGPATGGTAVAIVGTNFTGATEVDFGTSPATSVVVNSATSITAVSPAGASSVHVTVITPQGRSATTTADLFTYIPVPVITNLSPASGVVGTQVTITGTGFGAAQGSSTVTFAGTAAPIVSWSGTSIVAAVPLGAVTGNVVVTVNSAPSAGSAFTVLSNPTISSLNPSSGAVGSSVTINGSNFGSSQGSSTVTFNGIAATSIASWSNTQIVVAVPGGATTGNVVVTVNGLPTAVSQFTVFTVVVTPAISSLSPTSGLVGSSITISGSNFGSSQGSSTVTFNGTAATSITSWSNTQIVVTVPSGATTGNVVVTVNGVPSTGSPFTVLLTPVVSSINPASGAVGNPVTITGTNFGSTQGSSTVTFNGTTATSITSWSNTQIVVVVPTGATTGNVVVTVNGLASTGVSFTVTIPTSTVTVLTPDSAAVGGSVTITGTNFGSSQGTSTVTFNGTAATSITSWSDTQIVAVVPIGATTGNVIVTVNGAGSNGLPFTVLPTLTGWVLSGPKSSGVAISASVQLYAAGTTGYGTGAQAIGSPVQSDSKTGAFSVDYDCSTLSAPGDQLYLKATGSSGSSIVLMTALGSCASVGTAFPNGVTINEATTIASAFALAAFANTDTSESIDVGAPATYDATKAPKCNAANNWQSTGASTCNYIGLQNAFAAVSNLVDIPSGQVLAITPAYCKSAPCITATNTNTIPYYNTSIVPQGRINAMANALAACANPTTGSPTNCSTLIAATTIGASTLDTPCASANLNTPADTLQAALNIAHFPGDRSLTACGVDVKSGSGIYSLIAATPTYQPTLTSSTAGNTTTDLTLALIFQGGGLGAGQVGGVNVAGAPEATGLGIDSGGNIWVPTMSSTNGSVVVVNNLGAPVTASGTSATALGGYTGTNNSVFNPQSVAIDQNGNAWIGNSPKDGNHSQTDNGSLSAIQLTGSSLSALTVNGKQMSGLANSTLLTPAPYGLAIDATGNPWVSSNPGGTGNFTCTGGILGGSILGFDSAAGSVLNGNGYLNFSDNSSCPTAISFDQTGYLWTFDNADNGGADTHYGLLQLGASAPVAGTVVGGPYNVDVQNPSYSGNCAFFDLPSTYWNLAIDGLGDSWFSDGQGSCMDMIPNLTTASASELSNGTWGLTLAPVSGVNVVKPYSATVIDGGGNAWASNGEAHGLIGYGSINASPAYYSSATDTAMLSPADNSSTAGFNATDPSQNASGRLAGGTYAVSIGSCLDGSNLVSVNECIQYSFASLGVDGSGNLWIAGGAHDASGNGNTYGTQLTEFIGIAVPAQTPLSTALTNKQLGQKP